MIIIAPIKNIVNIDVCHFHQINQFPNHFFVTFYAENYFVALRSSLAVLSSASVRTIVLLTDSLKMMLMLMMIDYGDNDDADADADDEEDDDDLVSTWMTRDWLERRIPPLPLVFGWSRLS